MTPKRLINPSAYRVDTAKGNYVVVLERTHNTKNGNPVFNATIVLLSDKKSQPSCAKYVLYGHYVGEQAEAEYIVQQWEEERGSK